MGVWELGIIREQWRLDYKTWRKKYNTGSMWRSVDYGFISALGCHYPPYTSFSFSSIEPFSMCGTIRNHFWL